jgi:EAL domain-containing protein (putative c-di-GMP-specific phosphodiesterase class I)
MKFRSDFATIELTKLEDKGALYPIVLMVIANQIVNEFLAEPNRPKALIIDEFWKFIDNHIVMSFTEELARKVRKMNGMLITITQSIADYFKNERVLALYENANWKVMLKQPTSSIDMAVNSKKLSLAPFLVGLIKSVTKRDGMFGEFAIVTEGQTSIMRLKTDTLSHWVYTTNPKDKNQISNVMQSFKLSELMATKFLAHKTDHPKDDENQILVAIGALDANDLETDLREKKDIEKEILKSIKKSIRIESPILFAQPIIDMSKRVIYHEVLVREELSDGTIINPNQIFEIVRKHKLVADLEIAVLKKAIKYYKEKSSRFSINISLETLLDTKALEELRYQITNNNMDDFIIIEVTLKDVQDKETKQRIEQAISFLKEVNIRITNDNVDINTSADNFLGFKIDVLKLDGSVVKAIQTDSLAKTFAQVLISMAKTFNIKVCFIHIENEELYNTAKEFDIDFLQGNYIQEVQRIA